MGQVFTTTAKGEFAILKTQLRATELKVIVNRPTIEGTRYDLVIDDGRLHRVQVKYTSSPCSHSDGSVFVRLSSTSRSQRNPKHAYTEDEIDALLVYVSPIDKLCWLPSELWKGKHTITIRYAPSKNNQQKGCIVAQEYFW